MSNFNLDILLENRHTGLELFTPAHECSNSQVANPEPSNKIARFQPINIPLAFAKNRVDWGPLQQSLLGRRYSSFTHFSHSLTHSLHSTRVPIIRQIVYVMYVWTNEKLCVGESLTHHKHRNVTSHLNFEVFSRVQYWVSIYHHQSLYLFLVCFACCMLLLATTTLRLLTT